MSVIKGKRAETKKNSKYIEKNIYLFTLIKEIEFEDEKYFVLRSGFKINHLLPTNYYKNYNLEIGETVNCYIDKINCAGEIFLEPIHPFYKLNEVYQFKVLEAGEIKFKENVEFGVFVKDRYDKINFIRTNKEESEKMLLKKEVKLKLLRIKKGKFRLSTQI